MVVYQSNSIKSPNWVGTITNDFPYSRLAPGVLEEFERLMPGDKQERTEVWFHQWLTEDIGHLQIQEYLAEVNALRKASPDWRSLVRLVIRALPRFNETLLLELYDENGLPT